jgi:transcriptional regulator with XRE-family HTH domain
LGQTWDRLPETDSGQNFEYLEDTFEFQLKSIEKGAKNRIFSSFAVNPDKTPEKPVLQTLGSNIKRTRLEKGLTQLELSKLSKVNLSNLVAYEKDRLKNLDPFIIQKIARVLQINETKLFPNAPDDAKDAIDVLCPPVTIGSRIKNFRLRKHIQQKDLAKLLGIHKVSLCRYEKDVTCPDVKMQIRIEEVLKIPISL